MDYNIDRTKIKTMVELLVEKGFDSSTIRDTFLEQISNSNEVDQIIDYLRSNSEAARNQINYEIHRICLKTRGVNI